MTATVRFVCTTGLTLTMDVYAIDEDDLPTGARLNGAGDSCTEPDGTIYQAVISEALDDWHWAEVLYGTDIILSGYVKLTDGETKWIMDTPNDGVAPATNVRQSTGSAICYNEDGVVEAGVEIKCQQVSSSDTSGYAFDRAIRVETSNAYGMVEITGMWRGAEYDVWRGSGEKVRCTVPDDDAFDLPVVLGTT